MPTRKQGILAAALVASVVLFGVACSDDADSDSNASQSSIDTIESRLQRNEMMAAIFEMDKLELHGMDESLAEGTIESSFAPNTRTAVRVLALTNWDTGIRDEAATVQGHATDLLKALEDEDIPAAADAAHELHETAHDFEDSVWGVVAKDLPKDAGGVPDEEHEEAGTPESTTEASGTPEGDAGTPAAAATP